MGLFRRAQRRDPEAQAPRAEGGPTPVVSITDAAPCRKSLRLQIGPEAIAPIRSAVAAQVRREAMLPGFRKGKAPVELVERQHARTIQQETVQRVMRQALEDAATAHALRPVGPFEVTRTEFADAQGLTVEATVEVEPSFPLGAYKGIPLTRLPADVTADETNSALAKLQESMAQLAPSGEGGAKERRMPAVDDELAKDLGFETLDALRQHVEAKLREQKRDTQAEALEQALCDALLARHPFEVPAGLVSRQTERLTRDFMARLLLSGMAEERVREETGRFTEQLRTSAERHVKLAFILDRIAEAESVDIAQDELVGRLWQLARRWKKDPAEVRRLFDAQGLWPSVVSTIRQEKTIQRVLSAATIRDESPGGVTRHSERVTLDRPEA